jgi:hypothetical protein
MNKKVTGVIFAALTAVLISGTVLIPNVAITVFAAEQMSDQEQPTPPSEGAPKNDDNEHSGHDMNDMHDMKNM